MEYRNEVTLYGKVIRNVEFSHEHNGVPFYSVDVELFNSKEKEVPIARCYFTGDQLASTNIITGNLIHIDGMLINSKIRGVIDISVLVNNYEFIEEPKDNSSDYVFISGEVTKIFTNKDNYKGFINFIIAHFDENRNKIFSSRVIIWNRLGEYVFKNMNIGDKIFISGVLNNTITKSRPESPDEAIVDLRVSEIFGNVFTKLDDENSVA